MSSSPAKAESSKPKPKIELFPPNRPYLHNVAFVTGATGEMGRAVAAHYAAQGYRVFAVARDRAALKLKDLVAQLPGSQQHQYFVADLTVPEQARKAAKQCVDSFGGIGVLVMCAGAGASLVQSSTNALSSFSASDDEDLVLASGARIEMNTARAVSPYLRKQKDGGILLLTTAVARYQIDWPGLGKLYPWATAVTGLYSGLQTELRQAHVRVCLLEVGLSKTAFGRALRDTIGQGMNPALAQHEDKWIRPEDVAKSAYYMLNPLNASGVFTEVALNPTTMMDRNQVYIDVPRVTKLTDDLIAKHPDFKDERVALVTGCGKGIGRGIALELVRAGFHLAAVTRTAADLETLRAECAAIDSSRGFLPLALDVTDEVAIERAFAQTIERFGTLSLCVSNAGTNRRRVAAVADIKTWKEVLDVDLSSAMNVTRLALPWLLRHAKVSKDKSVKPSVILISTNYVSRTGNMMRMPGISVYYASKAGTNGFASCVLNEVREFGVGVSVINPGTVATPLGTRPNAAQKGDEPLIPREQLLQPEDVGRACVFIAEQPPNCVVEDSTLTNLYHGYPAIRNSQEKFLVALEAKSAAKL